MHISHTHTHTYTYAHAQTHLCTSKHTPKTHTHTQNKTATVSLADAKRVRIHGVFEQGVEQHLRVYVCVHLFACMNTGTCRECMYTYIHDSV